MLQGEPVQLRIEFHNRSEAPVELPVPWYFTWFEWPVGSPAPVVMALQSMDGADWVDMVPGKWHGPSSLGGRRGMSVPRLSLPEATRFVVWWDVLWEYDVPPGRYRVRPVCLSSLGVEMEGDPAGEWVEFTVEAATGKAADVWANIISAQSAPPTRRSFGPSYVLLLAARDDVDGTAYEFWRQYLELALPVCLRSPTAFLPGVWSEVGDLVEHPERYDGFPLLSRVILAAETVELTDLRRSRTVDEWNAEMAVRLAALRDSPDWQWAGQLAELLVMAEAIKRQERIDPLGDPPGNEVRQEWGLPWHYVRAGQ